MLLKFRTCKQMTFHKSPEKYMERRSDSLWSCNEITVRNFYQVSFTRVEKELGNSVYWRLRKLSEQIYAYSLDCVVGP